MPDTTLYNVLPFYSRFHQKKKVAFSVCTEIARTGSLCTLDDPSSTRVTVCPSRWTFIAECKSSDTLLTRGPLRSLWVGRMYSGQRDLKKSLNVGCSTPENGDGILQAKKNFATDRSKLFLTPELVVLMRGIMLSQTTAFVSSELDTLNWSLWRGCLVKQLDYGSVTVISSASIWTKKNLYLIIKLNHPTYLIPALYIWFYKLDLIHKSMTYMMLENTL